MTKSKKLSRGAFFSDIHFGKKSNSTLHNQDCLDYIEWFGKNAKEKKCDYIAFLGDWYESRSSLNVHTLNYSIQGAEMVNEIGLPVYFVIGNHDLYYRRSREVHSAITHKGLSNFTIIDEPTVIDEIKNKVFFCPYLFHEEYTSLAQYLSIPFWAGHFEFKGFVVTGYTITMKTGPKHTDFKGPKHIVSGHFHKRQEEDNVRYIGNTFPMDFSDANDSNRGMMVYDHNKNDMVFIDWEDAPQYTKTKLSVLLNEDPSEILLPNSRVKCLIDEPLSYDESVELEGNLTEQFNLREFSTEESPEIALALSETEIDIDMENMELESVDELVIIMLNQIETEHYDNNLLVDLYKNLEG